MYKNSYKYFENRECKYFPCHELNPDTDGFNCLFCYCPLNCRNHCPGNFTWIEKDGYRIKNCMECTYPHRPENYEAIMEFLKSPEKSQRLKVKQVFANYVAAYDPTNPKIALKIAHTYRVADLCERIARSEQLSEEDIEIAWLCGMLHDVGRFEQAKRYNTFEDSKSIDHANFGADLLFVEGLYENYVSEGSVWATPHNREIVERAIRNHSRFRLEEDLTKEQILFSNILRDADKIDIFRVNCETPLDEIYNVSMEELKNSSVSDLVKQDFREGHVVLRDHRKTAIDYVVSMVGLYNELVFPISCKETKDQGYMDQLLNFPTENEDAKNFLSEMRNKIFE